MFFFQCFLHCSEIWTKYWNIFSSKKEVQSRFLFNFNLSLRNGSNRRWHFSILIGMIKRILKHVSRVWFCLCGENFQKYLNILKRYNPYTKLSDRSSFDGSIKLINFDILSIWFIIRDVLLNIVEVLFATKKSQWLSNFVQVTLWLPNVPYCFPERCHKFWKFWGLDFM